MRTLIPLIALSSWPGLVAAAVPAAETLWDSGDYRGAFAEAIEPAIRGDAHAQFLIGEAYRLGRSVDPDFSQAEDWYARAARQGNVAAATELGLLLVHDHRNSAALPWLTLAAQRGDPRALCSLAALYFNGDGVAADEPLAYALMKRAERTGLSEAKDRMATLRTMLSPEAQNRGEELVADAIPDVPLPRPAIAIMPKRDVAPTVRLAVATPPMSPVQAAVAPVAVPIIPKVRLAAATPATTVKVRLAIATAAKAPAATSLRVQVGAFSSAAAAQRAWTLLASRIEGLSQTDHRLVQAGRFYRLQARFTDQQKAGDFCRHLTAVHWQHFTRRGTEWA